MINPLENTMRQVEIINRVEIWIENNSTLKWDAKKSLLFIQIYTNPHEVFFNLISNQATKSKEIEEAKNKVNENDNEGGEQSSQPLDEENKTTFRSLLLKTILCMGNTISEVMKAMCCFRSKNQLLSFLVYPKEENPVNFAQLNLFFFIWFTLDIILCSVVPLFFNADTVKTKNALSKENTYLRKGYATLINVRRIVFI